MILFRNKRHQHIPANIRPIALVELVGHHRDVHDAISRSQFYSVGPYSSGLKELRTPGAKQQAVRKMDGLLTVPPMESGKRLFYSSIPRKMSSRRKEIDKRDIEMHGSDGEEKEHKRNFKMNFFTWTRKRWKETS
ncbi:hypothetical protein HZH68_011695 [Vespula germanica]|uniref:Uncharacterized protein n=1 Tax=Vespula germanica TaxID=30212 RepID=A0A834N0N2_VESGE|nr:hypothetical protein HZH68_011695 [Vespula germanica]